MTLSLPAVTAWLLAAAMMATGILALRYRNSAALRAERIAFLERTLRAHEEETRHLLERRLPALKDVLSQGRPGEIPGLLHPELAGSPFARAHDGVLAVYRDVAADAEQSSQGLLLAVARKLQGLANNQQMKITEMNQRHDAPEFLQDLMDIDHTNAQILRRAVGMAVICKAWPGRQHNATPLHDVVRGAVGRILDYRRVHIVRIEDSRAVSGRAVEALVVTLAELLENATRSSNPSTPVQVHVQLTHGGVAVVIEDAGVGLNAAEREKASRLLHDDALGVAGLGSPPRFGLAACGSLARRYGFAVSVDSASAFGGVRAVVNIPSALLTDAPSASRPAPARPVPAPVLPRQAGEPAVAAPMRATTAGGLPKRTRQPAAQAATPAPAPADPARATARRSPREAAAPLDAFLRGSHAAAHDHRPTSEGTPEA
ncbi:ATP-binding protein [Streptomyces sp. NBC_00887]|uniref:ATP-binding protein n=1 Tax=Streptomyces sp. NBC_00887 TaxID=2975859 RepID=UPI0038700006|nr:ATP-binding protein [Streptomyces sp. NBC_00887]